MRRLVILQPFQPDLEEVVMDVQVSSYQELRKQPPRAPSGYYASEMDRGHHLM